MQFDICFLKIKVGSDVKIPESVITYRRLRINRFSGELFMHGLFALYYD